MIRCTILVVTTVCLLVGFADDIQDVFGDPIRRLPKDGWIGVNTFPSLYIGEVYECSSYVISKSGEVWCAVIETNDIHRTVKESLSTEDVTNVWNAVSNLLRMSTLRVQRNEQSPRVTIQLGDGIVQEYSRQTAGVGLDTLVEVTNEVVSNALVRSCKKAKRSGGKGSGGKGSGAADKIGIQ